MWCRTCVQLAQGVALQKVRITLPTGPKVTEPARQRDSLNRSAAGFGAAVRNCPSGPTTGTPAGAKTPATGTAGAAEIGWRQRLHQRAPGRTLAAQPGHRAVDVSEAIVTFIDSDRRRVDPVRPRGSRQGAAAGRPMPS